MSPRRKLAACGGVAVVMVWRLVSALGRDRSGVTSLEYALLGAFIAVVIASAVTSLGMQLIAIFTAVGAKV